MYDIVFISYNETNAEENWENLKSRFPRAKRVDGIKGIHQAHISAAKKCFTKMFWVVDADAKIVPEFDFSYRVDEYNLETVHVWRSTNPINDLVYGYGGVKLLPRNLTLNMDLSKPDMTTSISQYFKPMPEISNITSFNTDPFNTWKSAFRECVKLASKVIDRQDNKETDGRLQAWTQLNENVSYGAYAYMGAIAGKAYGEENADKPDALKLINDFDWLHEQFSKHSV